MLDFVGSTTLYQPSWPCLNDSGLHVAEKISTVLWEILIQFVFRLCLGLSVTMALTSPRQVNSGFYRVHLWVLLGLATFGSLVAYSWQALFDQPTIVLGLAITISLLSYVGSVIWLYEKHRAGLVTLWVISALTFLLLMFSHPAKQVDQGTEWSWLAIDVLTGSLLLGSTFAAMLLGHWYLNSPTMKLDPLRWLLVIMAVSLALRALLSLAGFAIHYQDGDLINGFLWAATAMRWLAGLVGLGVMTWMTWQTLKIPNTQSATGILYVASDFCFFG